MNQVHVVPELSFVLAEGAVLLLLAAEAVLAFCLLTAAYTVRPRLRGNFHLHARPGGGVTRA